MNSRKILRDKGMVEIRLKNAECGSPCTFATQSAPVCRASVEGWETIVGGRRVSRHCSSPLPPEAGGVKKRKNRQSGKIAAVFVTLVLLSSCYRDRARPASQKTPHIAPKPSQKTEKEHFFHVLTLPTYEMAKEAFDKTAILKVPFHEVADVFRKNANGGATRAKPSELAPAVRAEVIGLALGQTSGIIKSEEGFSILQKTTRAFYDRAVNLIKQKKDAAALALIRRALALNPDNLEAWLALARMMDEAGDLEETLAAYRKARKLAPENPTVVNKYAKYLVSQYRYEEAEEILKKAADRSSEDATVLLNLASLLVYLNKELALASRLIARGAEIDPGRAAWYRLSGVIQKRRRLESAQKTPDAK